VNGVKSAEVNFGLETIPVAIRRLISFCIVSLEIVTAVGKIERFIDKWEIGHEVPNYS
jgi:hypothetical protein